MKTKSVTLIAAIFLATAMFAQSATNDLSGALQKGLFEEEANHNLDTAIAAYQSVATQFDKDRKLAATAIFRLGEVYRKQGKTNEADAQYERILREFPDQTELVKLSGRSQDSGVRGGWENFLAAKANFGAIQRLEQLRMEAEVEYGKNRALLNELSKQSRDELKKSLPTVLPDGIINVLLDKLASAEQQLTSLKQDYTNDHTEVKKAEAIVDLVRKQVEARIDGILNGVATQTAISKARVEEIQEQLDKAKAEAQGNK
jgi:tetratricopeptide (TPR) repeat protein